MKFWKAIVPNLCISLWIALLTLVILNVYNPLMGFVQGTPFLVLTVLCAFCSIASAVWLYRGYRRALRRRRRRSRQWL